jgi:hypothetical protein
LLKNHPSEAKCSKSSTKFCEANGRPRPKIMWRCN